MSEQPPPYPSEGDQPSDPPNYQDQYGQQPPQQYGQLPQQQFGQPPYGAAPAYAAQPQTGGHVGDIRPTGNAILLYLVTCGFYSIYYFYKVHEDIKLRTGQGLGGIAALLWCLPIVSIAMPYILGSEVEKLYQSGGRQSPVNALTGLWYFPGMLILVGPFIWFAKTNGALNDYWASLGAQPK